jgi:hypothetical protein
MYIITSPSFLYLPPSLQITLLIDTHDNKTRLDVLTALATPDTTAKFYSDAQAYSINVLNGPSVPANQWDLGADAISPPDDAANYDGDTGLVKANETYDGSTFAQSAGVAGVEPSGLMWITLPGAAMGLLTLMAL